jgi:Bacterial PH domain
VVLFVGGGSIGGVMATAKTGDPRWLLACLLLTLALWLMARFAPTGYVLTADGVRVERRIASVTIPYTTIRAADTAPRSLAGLTLFGSRGVFGHFGTFWSPRLGNFRLFVTDRHRVVWLATERGWVGLSPDRSDEFLALLRARLPATGAA